MVKTFLPRFQAQRPAQAHKQPLRRSRVSLVRSVVLFAPAVALAALGTFLQRPAQAQSALFFCDTYQGEHATLVRSRQGNLPMILWDSGDFNRSGWTDQRRCGAVSQRLQSYHDNGKLRYLRTGSVGLYPVICVANQQGGSCPQSQVVVTLMPGTSSGSVYQRLRQISQGAGLAPVRLSGSDQLFFFGEPDPVSNEPTYYLDVPQWLYALDNGLTSQAVPTQSQTQAQANINFQELVPTTTVSEVTTQPQIVVPAEPGCDRPQTIEDYANCWGSDE